jgi:hypothetical protein
MIESDALRYVADLLGAPFLAYVTDVGVEQARDRIEGEVDSLGGNHEHALMATLEQASRWAPPPGSEAALAFPDGSKPDGSPATRLRRFGWVDMDEEKSFANLLRLSAGGSLPGFPEGLDGSEQALALAALDYYPVTLIPVPYPDAPFSELPVVSHARTEVFVDAVVAERSLERVCTPDGMFYTSTGFGFETQTPVRIMGCIIADAEQRTRAFGRTDPDDFVMASVEGLRTVRELCEQEHAEVPTQIGFSFIELPPGTSLCGPRGGRLRPARDTDLRITRTAKATMVLDTTSTLGISFTAVPPSSGAFVKGLEETVLDGQLVGMAGLLATRDSQPRMLPFVSWEKVFDPLSPFAGSFKQPRGYADDTSIQGGDLERFQEWIGRLETHYHHSVQVAIRRCISAFAERETADDALIDLVIALESLFGGPAELTLRISTSLAWLLGGDAPERAEIQRDAKRVYAARSKLVHGDELGDDQAHDCQQRAETLLLSALAELFSERTDLLPDSERAGKLMLDTRPS